MMAHPNEDLIRRGFDAFAKGDMDTLRKLFDADIVYHVPGRSSLAGDYQGPDEVLGLFARIFELSGGTYQAELHDAVANDDHTVALFTASGQREGATLDDRTVLVSHVRDGRLAEVWLLSENLYALDAFFS
jgi:ketosteroid isomerase-like protein